MTSCIKRSVIPAGDRVQRVRQAADNLSSTVNNLAQRVLPHAGKPNTLDRSPWNNPISHAPYARNANPMADAIRQIARAVDEFAREIGDVLQTEALPALPPTDVAPTPTSSVGGSTLDGRIAIRVVYQPYTEPMEIPAIDNFSIAAINCARVVVTQAPTEYLRSGTHVDFDFNGNSVLVRSIDGMTPGDPRVLTFTFVYFGV
jgi:hypothetical protein